MSQWNTFVAVLGLTACQSEQPTTEPDGETVAGMASNKRSGTNTNERSSGPYVNPPPPPELKITEVKEGTIGRLNAQTEDFGLVFRGRSRNCFVRIPSESPLPPGAMGPTRGLKCPDSMNNPAFEKCDFGIVVRNEDESCMCLPLGGNPPPPDFKVPCPQSGTEE